MFRNNFDKLLDKATSHVLMEPEWSAILQICDLIRQKDVAPKYALAALKVKLSSTNQYQSLYALLVLESLVKNCGQHLHEELTMRYFCDSLYELAKTTPHEKVRAKLLELIQAWNVAFSKNPKHAALKDLMATMKNDGFKFPTFRESDAMFSADSAPEWADGESCHRCRASFSLLMRKHHCRACGQVFCSNCSAKTSTLPKYGIEKEVRVCDACFDSNTKPARVEKGESELPAEYLTSSLAQQSQAPPPRKTEEELREEEELQLALAISQSEAEAKTHKPTKQNDIIRRPTSPKLEDDPSSNPELAKYLNRAYWETLNTTSQQPQIEEMRAASPSAPQKDHKSIIPENNGITINDTSDLSTFIKTLQSQVEIFINRMKSNSSRGRSIANDTSVQSLFLNITALHSHLFGYIKQHDDSRLLFERLQDKLTQAKDARDALDDLRAEHREKVRREAEEAERQRQLQMAHKLEIMRKKKQEYLQYQRQLALQRIQEQEREMQARQEQQKQQYLMGYAGAGQFGAMAMQQQQQQGYPYQMGPPGGYMAAQQPPQGYPGMYARMMPPNGVQMGQMQGPPNGAQMGQMQGPSNGGHMGQMQGPGQQQQQQFGVPGGPQMVSQVNVPQAGVVAGGNEPKREEETKTAELISFDD